MKKAQRKLADSGVAGRHVVGYLRHSVKGTGSLERQARAVEAHARRAKVLTVPFVDGAPVAGSGKQRRASGRPAKANPAVVERSAEAPAPGDQTHRTSTEPPLDNRVQRLAFYIRRAARIDDQAVIDRQRGSCSAVAEALGPHTSGDYVDDGCSGATMERPALRKLIRDVEAGLIDGVVVETVERLARSHGMASDLRELFLRHGVEVHASEGGEFGSYALMRFRRS